MNHPLISTALPLVLYNSIASTSGGSVWLRTSFTSAQGFPNDVLVRHGRTHDLIVVAQPDTDKGAYMTASPDDIALRSGRPVLVAPRTLTDFELGDGALLAWDGERAAVQIRCAVKRVRFGRTPALKDLFAHGLR